MLEGCIGKITEVTGFGKMQVMVADVLEVYAVDVTVTVDLTVVVTELVLSKPKVKLPPPHAEADGVVRKQTWNRTHGT